MISEKERSDFDEDGFTDLEREQVGPDLEELDELAEGVNAAQRESARDPRRRRTRLYRDDKGPFVLEIDDETDEDIMSVLLEEQLPDGIRLTTCQHVPDYGTGNGGRVDEVSNEQMGHVYAPSQVESAISCDTKQSLLFFFVSGALC